MPKKRRRPDTINRRAPPSLWLRLRNFLCAGALDLRLKETTRGSDNCCHHVVTKVVTMGQGYSLKTTALLRYEDLFEEPPTSYEVC